MNPKISRRQMLKLMAAAAGGGALVLMNRVGSLLTRAQVTEQSNTYLPLLSKNLQPSATPTHTPTRVPTATTPPPPPPPPSSATVVHVHSASANSWTGTPYNYWSYVNQGVIDTMVDQGMLRLTGATSLYNAWKAVLPNYQVGQKIAIKVSFNNTDQDQACGTNGGSIDGIIEPVNAIIRGLKTIGVAEADIHIYETIRNLPPYFVGGCDYPGVKFYDRGGCANLTNTFTSNDPNAIVQFSPPVGDDPAPPTLRINDVLIGATYLINVPIMKAHDMAGWSLAMKNHYGTTQKPGGLHFWSSLKSEYYTPDYSPIVDLYRNPHIVGKTILTVADGIFSAFHHTAPPEKWDTFGNNYPKSLFFSLDPVAIDCVMGDLLTVERPTLSQAAADHLALAHTYGLGTFERGNPWATPASSGYSLIDYQKIEL